MVKAALEAFGRLRGQKLAQEEAQTPLGPQPGSAESDAFNRRVEQENPQLFQPHQTGGWVGERPVSAENGEFITRKSMSERFSGLLEAINSGSLAGITDRLNSVLPTPIAVGAGAPAASRSTDQAMFHLTIGGETFKGLTAPRDTADALLQHARKSNVLSAGKKQSWYGS